MIKVVTHREWIKHVLKDSIEECEGHFNVGACMAPCSHSVIVDNLRKLDPETVTAFDLCAVYARAEHYVYFACSECDQELEVLVQIGNDDTEAYDYGTGKWLCRKCVSAALKIFPVENTSTVAGVIGQLLAADPDLPVFAYHAHEDLDAADVQVRGETEQQGVAHRGKGVYISCF